jgi:peptidoglycan-N-acetylglucosamine deacetylase
MDIPTAGPEAMASRPVKQFNPGFFLATLIILFLVSCTQQSDQSGEEKETIKKTGPDSSAIRQQMRNDSIARVSNQKKKIYLTFDDGPNAGTMNVLNAVIDEQVPVSFFIVAKHTRDSREQNQTWEKLKTTPGIELCNHSFSHAANRYSRFYKDPSQVVADFIRSNDSLHFNNPVARMPGRNAWRIGDMQHTDVRESKTAIDSVFKAGFKVMGWDVEWGFDHQSFAPDADTALIFRRMENLLRDSATKTPGHLVLLAHDQAFRSEEDVILLKAFLASLKKNPDYELVLASTYPGVKD